MFTILKTAAAVLVAAAGVTYFAVFPRPRRQSEFVEAAAKLHNAQTLSFLHTQTLTLAGKTETDDRPAPLQGPGADAHPSPSRPVAPFSIMNSIHNKILVLNPTDKSAMLMEEQGGGPAPKRDGAAMMIEDMRRLAGKDNEPVGEKVIGDVRAAASASRSKART